MEQRGDDPRYRVEGGHEVLVDPNLGMREDADTSGGLTDAEAMAHDQSEFPYRVEMCVMDETTTGVRLAEDDAELEFYIDPQYIPELVARLIEEHKVWQAQMAVEASKARHPSTGRYSDIPTGGATPL